MEDWADCLIEYPAHSSDPHLDTPTSDIGEHTYKQSSPVESFQEQESELGLNHPVIRDFQSAIENDAELYMLFNKMFSEAQLIEKDPSGQPTLKDYGEMLTAMNGILRQAPGFNAQDPMIGCPFNAILLRPMGTPTGTIIFLHPTVNRHLKQILNEWTRFLDSADSRYVLSSSPNGGWLSREAIITMGPSFETTFHCDPGVDYYGFHSWNHFFTRRLRPGARPVASPADDAVIVNACEAAPYRVAYNVKERDTFWIKRQPYSLWHILAGDDLTSQFVGGTVYQGYLNAVSYHRWHSPVNAEVVKVNVVQGSYYAQCAAVGYDPVGANNSQAYIAQFATRAIIFLRAQNPDIGLMCLVAIGMGDISSCQPTVYEGQGVTKGDELGTFRHGGSTQCLLFRPSVKVEFDLRDQVPGPETKLIPINEAIARIVM